MRGNVSLLDFCCLGDLLLHKDVPVLLRLLGDLSWIQEHQSLGLASNAGHLDSRIYHWGLLGGIGVLQVSTELDVIQRIDCIRIRRGSRSLHVQRAFWLKESSIHSR